VRDLDAALGRQALRDQRAVASLRIALHAEEGGCVVFGQ
jgi:hypothetical protein